MALTTLIRCHQNAFAYFGGWTKRILYDNMRQVVVGPNRTNARFLAFSRHYGFEAERHRPYRPRTKGKDERTLGYVRTSFLNGRLSPDSMIVMLRRGGREFIHPEWLRFQIESAIGRAVGEEFKHKREHLIRAGLNISFERSRAGASARPRDDLIAATCLA